jgi:hypothetical protein
MGASSPATTPRAGYGGLAVRVVLTLVGGLGMVASALLDWVRGAQATDLPVRGLIDVTRNQGRFVTSVGLALIILGLLAIVGLAPRTGWLTRLAGALGVAAVVLFVIGLYRRDLDLADLEIGGWIALIGSIVVLVGGFFGSRPRVVAATPPPATASTTTEVEP